jgi:hypothetical protein
MTPQFKIYLTAFIQDVLKSFSSQFICFMSSVRLTYIGHSVQASILFFSPDPLPYSYIRREGEGVEAPNYNTYKILNRLSIVSLSICTLVRHIPISFIWTRIWSPVLDVSILSQYLSIRASTISFQSIYAELLSLNLQSYDIASLQISLHGRTPMEAIRPRKTRQTRLLGSSIPGSPAGIRGDRSSYLIPWSTARALGGRVSSPLPSYLLWIRDKEERGALISLRAPIKGPGIEYETKNTRKSESGFSHIELGSHSLWVCTTYQLKLIYSPLGRAIPLSPPGAPPYNLILFYFILFVFL